MQRTAYLMNKIYRRDEQRRDEQHLEKLKRVRPTTSALEFPEVSRTLNTRKQEMLREERVTEIERANRLLFERITVVMNKPSETKDSKEKMNRSLNCNFRRKQLQNIELQNAKMLKRLQDKKSSYPTGKMREEWRKKRELVRHISAFPPLPPQSRARPPLNIDPSQPQQDIQLVRVKHFQNVKLVVTVRLTKHQLQILGEDAHSREIKIIELGRAEAMAFIQDECDGRIQALFDQLQYQQEEQALYLVGRGMQMEMGRQNVELGEQMELGVQRDAEVNPQG